MGITAAQVQAKRSETIAAGAFFEIEDYELDGETYSIYKHAPTSVIDVLQNARNHGDIEFAVYEGERYTYRQFFEAVDAFAACLQDDYGVKKGDRIAIAMRNNPAWLISYAAGTLIGAVMVPINSWGKTEELQYAIDDSGSRLLICDPGRYRLIEGGDCAAQIILAGADEAADLPGDVVRLEVLLENGRGREFVVANAEPEDDCIILYTSGSTGFPKGVVHRHIAMTQSLFNMMWLGYLVMELEGPREFRGGADRETPLLTVPLFHATGLLGGFYLPLSTGQKVVMMYKWDSRTALELIQNEKVTGLASVPAIIQDLLSQEIFDDYDTSSLIRVSAAGAATPAGLPELIQEKTGDRGADPRGYESFYVELDSSGRRSDAELEAATAPDSDAEGDQQENAEESSDAEADSQNDESESPEESEPEADNVESPTVTETTAEQAEKAYLGLTREACIVQTSQLAADIDSETAGKLRENEMIRNFVADVFHRLSKHADSADITEKTLADVLYGNEAERFAADGISTEQLVELAREIVPQYQA